MSIALRQIVRRNSGTNPLATALADNGQLVVDIGVAPSEPAEFVVFRIGRAADTLQTLQGPFDLCFIDADKPSYDYYYDRCLELVRRGGLIVLDNMLRYGRVLNPTEEDARIVNLLNDRIHNDPRVENVLLPFRDGIMLGYKL